MFSNNLEALVVFLFPFLGIISLNLANEVAHFTDLLPLVKHCSFVTVYPNNSDNYKKQNSFQLVLDAKQNYGSTEITFVVENELSLESITLGSVAISKRWFTKCTIWIQYSLAHIPFEHAILKPNVSCIPLKLLTKFIMTITLPLVIMQHG